MAKHNDMPELNSAKVFSTNLFTKEHLKPPCPHQLTTGKSINPNHRTCKTLLQGVLQALNLTFGKRCAALFLKVAPGS